jgi:hypothetical protein
VLSSQYEREHRGSAIDWEFGKPSLLVLFIEVQLLRYTRNELGWDC